MEKAEIQALIRKAFEGQQFAYTPYSHFRVGAALRAKDGRVYTGCNIENAGYTPTNCAERTAFFKAVSEGERSFRRIAIVAGPEGEKLIHTAPCGVCRQVLAEFCDPEMPVICANRKGEYKIFAMGDLLPDAFLPEDLKK